jgi:hypothetical protein
MVGFLPHLIIVTFSLCKLVAGCCLSKPPSMLLILVCLIEDELRLHETDSFKEALVLAKH